MAEQNSEIENLRQVNDDLAKQLRDATDKIGELSQIVKEKNASASSHESPVYPINSGPSTVPSATQNPPILNIPIPPSASDTQNQIPPPPPLGTYSFIPLPPTTSRGSPSTTQPIPPPIYTMAPPVPGFAPTNPVIVPDDQFKREIGGAESQKVTFNAIQRPPQPPYPKWFDENATCAYHSGAKGHSTENCNRLKQVI